MASDSRQSLVGVPEKIRQDNAAMLSNGAEGSPEGVFFRDKVYLIADQISSPEQAFRVLAHEALGHYGLRGVFGTSLDDIKAQLIGLRRKEVLAKAQAYGLDASNRAHLMSAAEEVLAEMAQTTPDIGFVKRAVAIIRTWLRQNIPGFKPLMLTDSEIIRSYIIPARGWVVRGQTQQTAQGALAFARGTNQSVTNPEDVVGNSQGGRSADDLQPGVRAARQIVKAIEQDGDYADYALRVIPGEFEGEINPGDTLPVSQRWVSGDMTEEQLEGTSAVRILNPDEKSVLEALRNLGALGKKGPNGYYFGNRIVLIKGESRGAGEDVGESIIEDAEVVGIWKKPSQGLSEIQPNESPAPDSDGAPMFSRTLAGTIGTALNSAREVQLPAGYAVGDFFSSNSQGGRLSWWHKSVGTMYNLAQRHPMFKTVYDATQDFLGDVSLYATEAADKAPALLPKLESWKDLTKTAISPEDTKAITAPINEGTLLWGRDAAGKAVKMEVLEEAAQAMTVEQKTAALLRHRRITEQVVKMWRGLPVDRHDALIESRYKSEMLKTGVVFSDRELTNLFGLNAQQIGYYQQFRAAIDESLTRLAVSDMLRYAGKDAEAVRDEVMAAGTVEEASTLLGTHLDELQAANPDDKTLASTANSIIAKAVNARDLMDRGYAPLSRFGTHSVDVVDNAGNRLYFSLFETPAQAARMARTMKAEYPQATVSQGTTSDESYKLFAGVSPETLELFGEMLGLESQGGGAGSEALQAYIKLAKSNRSAMKRLIKRKGVQGFSQDPSRVLAGFVYSNARQVSGNLHQGKISEVVAAIPTGQGELKDAAFRLQNYIKNPQEEAQKFRGLLFAQYLGGSVASAMVNMTQPFTVTLPYLSQYGGAAKAASNLARAAADLRRESTGDAALDAAMKAAEKKGILAPHEVHQLMAQANGAGGLRSGDGTALGNAAAGAGNALAKLSVAWGKLFAVAEQVNRRLTFIAAYRTAQEQRMPDPATFAADTIAQTQFMYNKSSKPRWARGAVGGTLFTFKQYSINYLELMSRMATQGGPEGKKAAMLMVFALLLMGGAGGLPFMKDAEDLADGILQRMGYNFSTKQKRNEFMAGLLGEDAARFIESGVSGLPGVPIDVSGRMGMGNMIPGTGILTKKSDYTRDVLELLGPGGDLVRRGFAGVNAAASGKAKEAVTSVLPVAGANLVKAIDMATTGVYKDQRGRRVIDVDGYDALSKAIGFQPNNVATVQNASWTVQNMVSQNQLRAAEISEQMAAGLADKDADKVVDARAAIKDWNLKNPETPLKIEMSAILRRVKSIRQSKQERIAAASPKAIRATVQREFAQ